MTHRTRLGTQGVERADISAIEGCIVGSLAVCFAGCMLALAGCAAAFDPNEPTSQMYANPAPVAIVGYTGDAMEPFVTPDGRFLLFNNSNDPAVDTNLHFAERIDALHFRYRGEMQGVNTFALEGVPTMDRNGAFYFVSTQSYAGTASTLYRGQFADGVVTQVELLAGLSKRIPGEVNFDLGVSADGNALYFVDSHFSGGAPQTADLILAERHGDTWLRHPDSTRLLASVNSSVLEYAPCISADSRRLLFTRARFGLGGGFGIYVAERERADQPFAAPRRLLNLGAYIEAPAFAADEASIYYHRYQQGSDGERFVIYRAALTEAQ